eukprot:EG_transcript_21753
MQPSYFSSCRSKCVSFTCTKTALDVDQKLVFPIFCYLASHVPVRFSPDLECLLPFCSFSRSWIVSSGGADTVPPQVSTATVQCAPCVCGLSSRLFRLDFWSPSKQSPDPSPLHCSLNNLITHRHS